VFDALLERYDDSQLEQLDELIGKIVKRLSKSGRAKAANKKADKIQAKRDKKAAKIKKKRGDKKDLATAKARLKKLKNKEEVEETIHELYSVEFTMKSDRDAKAAAAFVKKHASPGKLETDINGKVVEFYLVGSNDKELRQVKAEVEQKFKRQLTGTKVQKEEVEIDEVSKKSRPIPKTLSKFKDEMAYNFAGIDPEYAEQYWKLWNKSKHKRQKEGGWEEFLSQVGTGKITHKEEVEIYEGSKNLWKSVNATDTVFDVVNNHDKYGQYGEIAVSGWIAKQLGVKNPDGDHNIYFDDADLVIGWEGDSSLWVSLNSKHHEQLSHPPNLLPNQHHQSKYYDLHLDF
jgi:hypothetical protein